MRLLLLAGPGGGKGTQGALLRERLGLGHVAAGDLLRAEVQAGTEIGRKAASYLNRGALVPDEVVVELVTPAAASAARSGGYILDGFPRNLAQAEIASDAWEPLGIAVEAAVYLEVPDAELRRRLLARAETQGRRDDTPDVIDSRLRLFAETTFPVIDYYRRRGQLIPVAADKPPDAITGEILRRLSDLRGGAGASAPPH
jgi:adenylate kinase